MSNACAPLSQRFEDAPIRLTGRTAQSKESISSGAKQAAEKGLLAGELPKKHAAGAKAHVDFAALAARLKSCPVTKHSQTLLGVSFSAACKARLLFSGFVCRG
jgi:hypothetical protein